MKYFCSYRRDLDEQRTEAMRNVEKRVAELIQMGLKEPYPVEIAWMLPSDLLSTLPIDSVNIMMLHHQYDKELKKADAQWKRKHSVFRDYWPRMQQLFLQYGAQKGGGGGGKEGGDGIINSIP